MDDQDIPATALEPVASEPTGDPDIPTAALAPASMPVTKQSGPAPTWWNAIKGTGQAGLAMGSGALKSVNLAINDLLPGKNKAALKQEIEADPVMNYKAGPEAAPILGTLGVVTKPIGQAADWAKGKIASVAGNRAAEVAGDVATLAGTPGGAEAIGSVGKMAGKAVDAYSDLVEKGKGVDVEPHPLAAAAADETARLQALRARGQAKGLALPDGGTTADHAAAAAQNQPIANAMTREDLKLPAGAPLTRNMLKDARTQYASPAYEAVKAVPEIPLGPNYEAAIKDIDLESIPKKYRPPASGVMSGEEAVDFSKDLRFEANQYDKHATITGSPDSARTAQTYRDAAEAVEDAVKEHVPKKMGDAWDAARVYTAKTYSAENALDGAGNIKVTALKQQLLKKKPLSGQMADLAELGAQHPRAFTLTPSTAPAPGILRRGVAAVTPLATGTVGGVVGNLAAGPAGAGVGGMLGHAYGDTLKGRILGQ